MHKQIAGVLNVLPRRVRVEIHNVMRIDEADEKAPGLAFIAEWASLAAQPRDRAACDQVVK